MEKKYKKKEKDLNVLNINFTNLLHQNKLSNITQNKLQSKIELLKEENYNLNQNLMKYNNNNNFLGISFIEDADNDNNYFYNDKCLEDILNELDNKTQINQKNNNKNEKNFYSSASKFYPQNYKNMDNSLENNNNLLIKNLKENFGILIQQTQISQNSKGTIATIMNLLGYNDNEIYKMIGNSRGVISVPSSNNKYKK